MPPPAHQTKVNRVYDELSRGGVVTFDKVAYWMQLLNIQVSEMDLSRMLGLEENMGVISTQDWERFAEEYPTVIDSLYYRIGDEWRTREQEEVQNSVEVQIQRQLSEYEGLVEDQQSCTKTVLDLQEDLKTAHEKHRISSGNLQEARTLQFTAVESAKEAEEMVIVRQAELDTSEYRRKQTLTIVEGIENKMRAAEKKNISAETKLVRDKRELEELLLHAEALRGRLATGETEVRESRAELSQLSVEADEARSKVTQRESEILKCREALVYAEKESVQKNSIMSQTHHLLTECEDDDTAKLKTLIATQHHLVDAQSFSGSLYLQTEASFSAAQHFMRDLTSLQEDYRKALLDREATTIAEQPLIDAEISLRKQRHLLTEQEEQYRIICKQHERLSRMRTNNNNQPP
eukprot:TRINITY_DN5175_c2_g1_i1.p1 TRINITY_DN5175_c2_g1~~TRINITY_DN5175_c2_g1_i1.p1  ORF type:complete len:421 (+),score=79.54 TRINITY_DN5175_c2_g1_i1:46-1263(+)